VRIPLDHIEKRAQERPPGYKQMLYSLGTVDDEGGYLELDDEVFRGLVKRFKSRLGSMIASEENVSIRKSICAACADPETGKALWDPDAWLGAGGCRKCRCSVAKLYWWRSKCPIGRWS